MNSIHWMRVHSPINKLWTEITRFWNRKKQRGPHFLDTESIKRCQKFIQKKYWIDNKQNTLCVQYNNITSISQIAYFLPFEPELDSVGAEHGEGGPVRHIRLNRRWIENCFRKSYFAESVTIWMNRMISGDVTKNDDILRGWVKRWHKIPLPNFHCLCV